MPDYGSDLSCTFDLDPMMRIVSGEEMMAQVCVRRLTCRKGNLLSDPLYGIDVRDFLGAKMDTAAVARIQSLVSGELTRDERIFTATVLASFSTRTKVLTLTIQGVGASGPFGLVLAVDQVTVQILSAI